MILILAGCNDKPDIRPADNQLAVFPNPAQDDVNIMFSNPSNGGYTLIVFDTKGEMILEKNESFPEPIYRLNISDEPVGTYHVVLKRDDITIVRQFMKSND